jgi:hypothetical protein
VWYPNFVNFFKFLFSRGLLDPEGNNKIHEILHKLHPLSSVLHPPSLPSVLLLRLSSLRPPSKDKKGGRRGGRRNWVLAIQLCSMTTDPLCYKYPKEIPEIPDIPRVGVPRNLALLLPRFQVHLSLLPSYTFLVCTRTLP